MMKRIKDVAFISTLSYTLLMLTLCAMQYAAVSELGDKTMDVTRFGDNAFVLFVYSVCIGLSFLLFDIKLFSKTVKRALHFMLNYGLMMVFIFAFSSVIASDAAAIAFVLSFVYLVVYFGGMLVCSLLRKADKALTDAKK